MTRKEINELNVVEPYCVETDREEQWFNVGLKAGLDVGEKYMIDKACEWLCKNMIDSSYLGANTLLSFHKADFIERFKKAMEE